jgi:hypothetical protein
LAAALSQTTRESEFQRKNAAFLPLYLYWAFSGVTLAEKQMVAANSPQHRKGGATEVGRAGAGRPKEAETCVMSGSATDLHQFVHTKADVVHRSGAYFPDSAKAFLCAKLNEALHAADRRDAAKVAEIFKQIDDCLLLERTELLADIDATLARKRKQ